jgi:hypothetical protein
MVPCHSLLRYEKCGSALFCFQTALQGELLYLDIPTLGLGFVGGINIVPKIVFLFHQRPCLVYLQVVFYSLHYKLFMCSIWFVVFFRYSFVLLYFFCAFLSLSLWSLLCYPISYSHNLIQETSIFPSSFLKFFFKNMVLYHLLSSSMYFIFHSGCSFACISFHFFSVDIHWGHRKRQCNIADIICPHKTYRSSWTTGLPVLGILSGEVVI